MVVGIKTQKINNQALTTNLNFTLDPYPKYYPERNLNPNHNPDPKRTASLNFELPYILKTGDDGFLHYMLSTSRCV